MYKNSRWKKWEPFLWFLKKSSTKGYKEKSSTHEIIRNSCFNLPVNGFQYTLHWPKSIMKQNLWKYVLKNYLALEALPTLKVIRKLSQLENICSFKKMTCTMHIPVFRLIWKLLYTLVLKQTCSHTYPYSLWVTKILQIAHITSYGQKVKVKD